MTTHKKCLHNVLVRKVLPFSFVILLFILVLPTHASAFQHQILNEVLGVSTSSAFPQIPPTAEGPGLILPDSPLFFLDQLKQNVRLLLAFTPEAKAQVHTEIAGERLAELRFMLAKNNARAATVALQGIADNLQSASKDVANAQFSGKDVKVLAQQINDNIKAKQKTLDLLEKSTTGSFNLEVAQAQESIFESKVQVEDALPDEVLQNEVKEDLARKIEQRVNDASQSAKLLKRDLDELEKEASDSAKKSLERRQEALKEAISKSDESLRKVQEKLLESEKKKQEALFEAQGKAAEQAQKALINAQNAATSFQKAQSVIQELQSQPSGTIPQTTSGSNSGGGETKTPQPVSNTKSTSGGGGESETGR